MMRPIQMSEKEYVEMVLQIIDGAGPEEMEREELERIVDALHQMRVDAGLVAAFDAGELTIRWKGNEPTFKISEKGLRAVRLGDAQ